MSMFAESLSKYGINHPLIIPHENTNGTALANPSILNYNEKLYINIIQD